ncbi:hypothetical protein N8H22_10760 [Stutzerimonas stutzeri]|uniref:hypothetical protein n=1 Tax=Stutzerimonas sp. S1 TaxID=3030652 RepID=UPI00222517F1|nr:hypothetical protein [Stutzerimonas sp. S1]
MDYFIIAITTVAGLAFHAWLFFRFRRWAERDLALSIAGSDPDKRAWLLARLGEAKARKIKRSELQAWLEHEALQYPESEPRNDQ